MAITRLYPVETYGYGQIEPNHVTFTVDGRSESQLPFVDGNGGKAENGMLLAVDVTAVRYPSAAEVTAASSMAFGIHYSTEHNYDGGLSGRKNFYLGADKGNFYPRVGFLAAGEKFTVNGLCADITSSGTGTFASVTAAIAALKGCEITAVYGGISDIGLIKVSGVAPAYGPVLKAVKLHTMPDGNPGVKFQVIKG